MLPFYKADWSVNYLAMHGPSATKRPTDQVLFMWSPTFLIGPVLTKLYYWILKEKHSLAAHNPALNMLSDYMLLQYISL